MGTCATCKHWDKFSYRDTPVVRKCNAAIEIWEATEWDDDCNNVLKPQYANNMLFVNDGSGYSASLLTRAEFSCAAYEQMPDEKAGKVEG